MADDDKGDEVTPEQDAGSDDCLYPAVCTYHTMMRAKVRAVVRDGEIYVNAKDAADWIKVVHEHDLAGMMSDSHGAPDKETGLAMQAGALNFRAGGQRSEGLMLGLAEEDIEPIADPKGTLIDPEELTRMANIPDAPPASWSNEEKQ